MSFGEDLKTLRNWILGVIGFATALSTFLVNALHFPVEETLLTMAGLGVVFIVVIYLIGRAEQRTYKALQEHKQVSDKQLKELTKAIADLKEICLETTASTLRIEMNDEIARHPENHDTILKMAHKYFVEYGKDWVETDAVLLWKESEEKAGRKVHIPAELLGNILAKKEVESK